MTRHDPSLDGLRPREQTTEDTATRSEMIERVARAIEPAWFFPDGWPEGSPHPLDNHEGQHKYYQAKAYERASAAIAAMREPTGEMWSAGRTRYGAEAEKYRAQTTSIMAEAYADKSPKLIWRAMIDAALGDDKRDPSKSAPSLDLTQARGASTS